LIHGIIDVKFPGGNSGGEDRMSQAADRVEQGRFHLCLFGQSGISFHFAGRNDDLTPASRPPRFAENGRKGGSFQAFYAAFDEFA
jgi:hypothetical protein